MNRALSQRAVGWLPVVALLLSSPAFASGLHVTRFAGEQGHPTAENPTAIYFNPAAMALGPGYHVLVDVNWGFNIASYERFPEAVSQQPPSEASIAANTGEASFVNLSIIPFIGVVTDFGTGAPFGVGVAFYAPFGGSSAFPSVDPVEGAPGSSDGPQRWWVIEGTMQTLALSVGGAYEIESLRLSFGATFNVFFSAIDSIQAQNGDGSDDLVDSSGRLKEGRARVDATSTDFGFGAGVLWEPIERMLWVGASYQSRPNVGSDMELEGSIDTVFGESALFSNDLTVRQQMPDTLRLGFRYRPSERVELRLFGDWTRWSAFEDQCFVNTDREDDPERACQFNADGSPRNPDTQVVWNVRRQWDDTFSVRLGASWWVKPWAELMAGAGWEPNSIPDATFEPGLLDMNFVTATIGARLRISPVVSGMLQATNWFGLGRDTRGNETFAAFLPPSRQPNSAGVYEQNIFTLNFTLQLTFGGGDGDEAAGDITQ